MEAYFGNPQQARADAETALKVSAKRDSGVTSASALALALAGDTTQAEKLAAELSQKFPLNTRVQRCALPTIHAAVALHRGNADKALELLPGTMGPYDLGATALLDPMYIRGRAYLMLQDGGAAAVEFRKVIDHPWHRTGNLVGALAHLGLARAYALRGEKAKSRTAYQDFLALWKDADPDIPILQQAKVEYAKLNETHESKTDPDAKMARKGKGKEAKLSYNGNLLVENRNGLIVNTEVFEANGTAERDAALVMLEQIPGTKQVTVGGDKAYDTADFVAECRNLKITPHVAHANCASWRRGLRPWAVLIEDSLMHGAC